MSSPQSNEAEEKSADPPTGNKGIDSNGDATASPSSSGAENPAATPVTPTKKETAAPPSTPSQPATFVYDPNKITLKFIFANRDGVHVILECKPSDTVGEIKGALLSVWPEGEI